MASGSVSTWGQSDGGGMANIGILTVAPELKAAPAAIWFEAIDISGFDVNGGPGPGETYDPSFHGIMFIWTVRGTPFPPYSAPENMIPAWNDANRAYGKKVAFAFPAPGTYTVDLWAVDRAGQTATAETTVTIADPDIAYQASRTVCFSNDPAETWTDEKPGCQRATTVEALQAAIDASVAPNAIHILFKRGQVVDDIALQPGGGDGLGMIGTWGGGARPVLNVKDGDYLLRFRSDTFMEEIVLSDLDCRGKWDATTELGYPSNSFLLRDKATSTFLTLHGCRFSGFTALDTQLQHQSAPNFTCLADCEITNWRDYGIFHGSEDDPGSRLAIIGTKIAQHPDALNGGDKNGFFNTHGPIRYSNIANAYFAVLDLFSRCGWSGLGTDTADQPCIRANTSGGANRTLIGDRIVAEGGFWPIALKGQNGGASGTPEFPGNFLLDKLLVVATSKTIDGFLFAEFGGTTIRNVVGILPDTPRYHTGNGWTAAVDLEVDNPDPTNAGSPTEIYNVTFISLLGEANDPGFGFPLVSNTEGFTTLTIENNLAFAPDHDTPVDGEAPIDLGTPIPGVTLRYAGVRFNFDIVEGTLAADVPDAGSFTVPYSEITTDLVRQSGGSATDQAYWQATEGTDTRHMILAGGNFRLAEKGEIAVAFEGSAVRVANLSGELWEAGSTWKLRLDRASRIPAMQTIYANPATVPLPRPGATSPAADSGDLGRSAHDDFLGAERPSENRARGALKSLA